MNFGVPNQRVAKKAELFPNVAVLTVGIDGGKGTAKSMMLNDTASDVLGLKEVATVVFGFEDGKVFITNGNQAGIPEEHQIRVTKGSPRKISEKRTYTYISEKLLKLDNSVENHFELVPTVVADGEVAVFELKHLTSIPQVEEVVFEAKGSDFDLEETIASDAFTAEGITEEEND